MGETIRQFRANPYAGYVDVLPAKRLANTIGTVKVVLIGLVVIGSAITAANVGSDGAGLLVLVYGFVSAVSVYVTFGWLEQTLRVLIGIAYNTAESADLMAPAEPVDDEVERP